MTFAVNFGMNKRVFNHTVHIDKIKKKPTNKKRVFTNRGKGLFTGLWMAVLIGQVSVQVLRNLSL